MARGGSTWVVTDGIVARTKTALSDVVSHVEKALSGVVSHVEKVVSHWHRAGNTAATVQGNTVAPVSDRAIDRRAYLQEPANLRVTRERVALQKRARDITRGDKPVTDLAGPGARNIPTGTNGRLGHANNRHPRHVTEVVEAAVQAGAIDRLLVLQVSRRE